EIALRVGFARERASIGDGARRVGGTVGAVRTGAEDDDVVEPRDIDCRREYEFLIAPAQPLAAEGDRRLAAGNDARGRFYRAASLHNLSRDGGVHTCDVARLALNLARENQRAVPKLASSARRGVERETVAADHSVTYAREERVTEFRRFGDLAAQAAVDALADARRQGDSVLREDRGDIGECGRVGRSGSGADDIEIVADDVREQQRFDGRRRGEARELSTLDAGDVFSQRVHLMDVRTAG